MKRFLSATIAVLLLLTLFGCSMEKSSSGRSSRDSGQMSLENFTKKYKRADYSAFLEDPSDFLSDLADLNDPDKVSVDSYDFENSWVYDEDLSHVSDDFSYLSYSLDDVLFNLPMTYDASVYYTGASDPGQVFLSIVFDTGSWEKDYEIAKGITSSLLDSGNDAETINIDDEAVSEAELRKLFLSSDGLPKDFYADFGDVTISFYCFDLSYRGETDYSTFVNIYSYPSEKTFP